ncbi:MAG: hypothetical protein U0457_17730 [Candidatus Sericytochromatia bacterium]
MSGIGSFFSRTQQPLETSGDITLKKGVTQEAFVKKIDKSLDDGILTKKEYKQIKDSMVGGRSDLNRILSEAGIADLKQLDDIFGRGKTHGYINISPSQKNELKKLLTENSHPTNNIELTNQEAQLRDSIVNKHLSINRSDLTNRYTLDDFIFSPEVSGIFKDHCNKELSSENINFLVDTKNILQNNPTKDSLKGLYNNYIKNNSDGYINISFKNRLDCDKVFSNHNSSLLDMMKSLENPIKEIKGLSGDTFSRFKPEQISQAIINEAVYLPAGSQREGYIKSIIEAHQDNLNKMDNKSKNMSTSASMISIAKKALTMVAQGIEESGILYHL